jgi:hypothetical protein
MSPPKGFKEISTSVLSSIYGLLSCVVALISRPILIIVRVVSRIRTGSISSQHYNEFINVVKYKQREFHSKTLEENRLAIEYDREILCQCILEGEQQAKCFTLALLIVVFVWVICSSIFSS